MMRLGLNVANNLRDIYFGATASILNALWTMGFVAVTAFALCTCESDMCGAGALFCGFLGQNNGHQQGAGGI
jgi:hypothetical protein